MKTDASSKKPACTPAEIDEAAVWIARLHAPDRTLQVERGFRRWLASSPGRAQAFETVSAGWELAGMLQRKPFPRMSRWERAGFRQGFMRASAVVAAMSVVAVAVSLLFYFRDEGVTTNIGEQRVVTLEDGTRITLNTSTRIVTRYDEHERKVELRSGEALFEVAKKDASWPFVVVAGNRTITALGTSFVVREDEKGTSVVLVEGKVAVATVDSKQPEASSAPQTLSPGQRLTFAHGEVALDEPGVQKVVAWRWGQVELEDTSLEAAAEEMNRYSTVKLLVATPEARNIRINGVFRTGDTSNFAAALAETYGLTVVTTPDAIVLEGAPRASRRPAQ
jgi:transmembrane sensor